MCASLAPLRSATNHQWRGTSVCRTGNFSQLIKIASADELGDLAGQINTVGQEIAQMLDAKRALLLAISHNCVRP